MNKIQGKTIRSDGYIFGGYYSSNDRRNGKEKWYSPLSWDKKQLKQKERKKYLRNKFGSIMNRYKKLKGCNNCGYNDNPYALQFHHINKFNKINSVSCIWRTSYNQWKKIKNEIRKCIVLCANCHAVETYKERNKT
jgi:hypothetical protein|tara:strand:- start:59 stop:466 length:408 start_codon:yes stop_codon:yes gene_type:complete